MTFYLSISAERDARHPAYDAFLSSAKEHTNILLISNGRRATLESAVQNRNQEKYHFVVFESDDLAKIDKTYFARTAAHIEPLRGLSRKIALIQEPSDIRITKSFARYRLGDPDEIIEDFNKTARIDGGTLLLESIGRDKHVHDALVKRTLFGGVRMQPWYVAVGLHTTDEQFILRDPQLHGPYTHRDFAPESLKRTA